MRHYDHDNNEENAHAEITGAALSLSILGGLSTNPKDHFIDVDTDSMETAPDVRVYFWNIGHAMLNDPEIRIDLDGCKAFDTNMDRAGRKFLLDLKGQGVG